MRICSHPRPWDTCVLLQETLGLALDKLLKPSQALAGALTMPLHLYLIGISDVVLPQPKPGPQLII